MDINVKQYKFVVDSNKAKFKILSIIEKIYYTGTQRTFTYSNLDTMSQDLRLVTDESDLRTRLNDKRCINNIIITITRRCEITGQIYTDSYFIRQFKASSNLFLSRYVTVCNKLSPDLSSSLGLQ